MVAGIEIAGLVLAVFPAVIEVVDLYSGALTGRDIRRLAGSLTNQEQIFKNVLEGMLRSIVSEAKLQKLLDDPQGDAWKDDALNEDIRRRLGPQADIILNQISGIHRTVVKLQEKLPVNDSPPFVSVTLTACLHKAATNATTDQSIAARAKVVIKSFVRGPHYKGSLDGLRIKVEEIRVLTEGSLKLAPSRSGLPDSFRDLALVWECADCLYNELQDRWGCKCDELHPANMQLDIWPARGDPDESDSEKVDFKFAFLFASDVQTAQSDHWITAEIAVSKKTATCGILGTAGSGSVLSRSPVSTTMHTNLPARPAITPATAKAAKAAQSAAIDEIQDLCAVVNGPENRKQARRRRLSSVSGPNGHDYNLFIKPDPTAAARTTTSLKVADALNRKSPMSCRVRVQLALMLAWGVLQISSTSWLKGQWTKDNLLLVMDDTNKPSPYISHAFQSARRGSHPSTLTPTPTISTQVMNFIKNASLFALGVFLLEVCHNRSIEDLAAVDEKDEKGKPWAFTPFLTANRLSKTVKDEMGLQYAHAVDACLNFPCIEMNAEGKPKDPSGFARSIMKDIIEPLKIVAKSYGD